MFFYLILFVFGAVIGSFLNVCIYRIPRNRSIIWPSSRCPSCNNPIKSYDNIPIFSYFLLRGRCRFCKGKISGRYPLVEALNAFFWLLVFWRFGPGWNSAIYAMLCSAMIVITFIDYDFQIIPDRITLPGIPLGLVAGSFFLPDPFLRATDLGYMASLIGAGSGFLFFYLIAFLSLKILKKEGMGGGDIKLMAMTGAFLGWKAVILTTFLGSLFGSIIGIGLMVFKGRQKGSLIPFGPFLAAGALISLFFGQEILKWYLY
ncbi:MAG: prepilin peptidase [Nitrospira bacterium HGW-Nitrospira-1]|nr:MAG: prepilin peptidase [Nitrospira bacterium HGW-Nitrospira-1]